MLELYIKRKRHLLKCNVFIFNARIKVYKSDCNAILSVLNKGVLADCISDIDAGVKTRITN